MRTIHVAVLMVGSAIGGMAAIVSCGDHGGEAVDAAPPVCDCQGFEPQITPSRIYRAREIVTPPGPPTTSPFVGRAACDDGDMVIGGGCATILSGTVSNQTTGPTVAGADFAVLASTPINFYDATGASTGQQEGWTCVWDNRSNTGDGSEIAEITAICLDIKP